MKINDNQIEAGIIRDIRLRLMMSQAHFAKILGVSASTENRWEKGHHRPSFKTQRKIRQILFRLTQSR